MAALARKLASIAAKAARRLRSWAALMRERARLVRRSPGVRVSVPLQCPGIHTGESCCGCGGPATTTLRPGRALLVLLFRLPPVDLGMCAPCASLVRGHVRFGWLSAVSAAAAGTSAALLVFALRPWSSWPWMCVAAAAGASLALLLRLFRSPAPLPSTAWLGAPARWIGRRDGMGELETPSSTVEAALRRDVRCAVRPIVATERDGRLVLVAGLLVAGFLAPRMWLELHPVVRVLNLGSGPVHVVVDGRSVGTLAPSWTEAPNGGVVQRVPVGERVFEAFDLKQERVDVTRARLERDRAVVYAPAHQPFCLWIEQRAYGKQAPPKPSVLRLPAEASLYTLPVAVDAWFQPNPAANARDRFFSGGIRRTLRHGPCAAQPAR